MKVSGTATMRADRATVYRAFNDPAILVRTIPGCQRLEALGEDTYKMTVAAGVGSIKGVYDGKVSLSDQQEPDSFRMHAQGAGSAGTIGADVAVTLADAVDGGTSLTYVADAVVGGMIGGVGQRMLTGVSKRMANEFFGNVDSVLAGPSPSVEPSPLVEPIESTSPSRGTVFTAPDKAPTASNGPSFPMGIAVGAAAVLLGAIVGGWLAGRRRGGS